MRRLPVLAVLCLAGCEVASRNATELQFLGDVEAMIDARDRCGLYDLVTRRPGALSGSDPLAKEFRDFVSSSRPVCRFGALAAGDGGSAPFPDPAVVAAARGEPAVPQVRDIPFLALRGIDAASPEGRGQGQSDAGARPPSPARMRDRQDEPKSAREGEGRAPSAAHRREANGREDRGASRRSEDRGASHGREARGGSRGRENRGTSSRREGGGTGGPPQRRTDAKGRRGG